jgi:hypothetical protein
VAYSVDITSRAARNLIRAFTCHSDSVFNGRSLLARRTPASGEVRVSLRGGRLSSAPSASVNSFFSISSSRPSLAQGQCSRTTKSRWPEPPHTKIRLYFGTLEPRRSAGRR